ncbi:hypothetical protein DEJ50_18760 [Streptomyces venezuelae]|uniref:Uncharacterized protein n=1 Tax=Streptomyces venezuelae TaxID=54571 RepID=A0A5P2D307_STRVZ|nr:hypothetical protein [Streptomyces venezuelae]QES49542.1 hypothetical protein DEJ50_18760 [Streptomyces venezuelae]
MDEKRLAVVQPPDGRGLREVAVGGTTVGSAWSLRGLRRLLRRAGFPKDLDLTDGAAVRFDGGDSTVWPDRRGRRYATVLFVVAGLLVSAGLLMVVGTPDAMGGVTFAGRVTGLLFILAGGVEVVAAAAALDYWGKRHLRYSGSVVMLGVLVAFATDTLFLGVWFQEREYTRYLLVFLPLWCWSVAALVLLYRQHAWERIPFPKGFTVGVLVTALLSASNLAYSAVYQPYSRQPQLDLTVAFGRPRPDPGRPVVHLPLTLRMKNTGAIPLYVLGGAHWVWGRSARFSAGEVELKDWKKDMEWLEDIELHVEATGFKLIHTGPFVVPGTWFDPGDGATVETIVQVPKDAAYDALEATTELMFMRKDRGKIDEVEFARPRYSWDKEERQYFRCAPKACQDHVFYRGRLRHNNNLINVTRRPRYVTSYWSVNGNASEYGTHIGPLDSGGRLSGDEEPDERYGAFFLSSNTAKIPFVALVSPQV